MLVLNVLLLIAVGVLYFLFFQQRNKPAEAKRPNPVEPGTVATNHEFRIAYFEMDSIENNFEMVKEVKQELSRKQDEQNATKLRLQNGIQNLYNEYQTKGPTLNEQQIQSYQNRLTEMDNRAKTQMEKMDRDYQDLYMHRMQDVTNQIRDFLKDYNKNQEYAYIFSYEPGIMYYRDTIYNITADIVQGLNRLHKQKKNK